MAGNPANFLAKTGTGLSKTNKRSDYSLVGRGTVRRGGFAKSKFERGNKYFRLEKVGGQLKTAAQSIKGSGMSNFFQPKVLGLRGLAGKSYSQIRLGELIKPRIQNAARDLAFKASMRKNAASGRQGLLQLGGKLALAGLARTKIGKKITKSLSRGNVFDVRSKKAALKRKKYVLEVTRIRPGIQKREEDARKKAEKDAQSNAKIAKQQRRAKAQRRLGRIKANIRNREEATRNKNRDDAATKRKAERDRKIDAEGNKALQTAKTLLNKDREKTAEKNRKIDAEGKKAFDTAKMLLNKDREKKAKKDTKKSTTQTTQTTPTTPTVKKQKKPVDTKIQDKRIEREGVQLSKGKFKGTIGGRKRRRLAAAAREKRGKVTESKVKTPQVATVINAKNNISKGKKASGEKPQASTPKSNTKSTVKEAPQNQPASTKTRKSKTAPTDPISGAINTQSNNVRKQQEQAAALETAKAMGKTTGAKTSGKKQKTKAPVVKKERKKKPGTNWGNPEWERQRAREKFREKKGGVVRKYEKSGKFKGKFKGKGGIRGGKKI